MPPQPSVKSKKKRWPYAATIVLGVAFLGAVALFVSGIGASDPILGHWNEAAVSSPDTDIRTVDPVTSEKNYLEFNGDHTYIMVFGEDTSRGTWQNKTLEDGTPYYVLESEDSTLGWMGVIDESAEGDLGPCLGIFVRADPDYKLYFLK